MRRAKTHYPPPPAPQQKRKRKRFHASQTQINQGTGEAPWLGPWYSCSNYLFDWPAKRAWCTSVPFRQNKSNYERTNDISYREEITCTTASNKCEKRAKCCAKLRLTFPLDSLKSWYQASNCSKGGNCCPLEKFLSSGWRSWCIFIYWIAVVALSTLCRNHKHSDAKLNQKRKPLYFKVLIDWATFLSHLCLDRPRWPIQLFRHENWSTPRCRHHQKVLFALFVYCF